MIYNQLYHATNIIPFIDFIIKCVLFRGIKRGSVERPPIIPGLDFAFQTDELFRFAGTSVFFVYLNYIYAKQ
jgi:hypothetical protein